MAVKRALGQGDYCGEIAFACDWLRECAKEGGQQPVYQL